MAVTAQSVADLCRAAQDASRVLATLDSATKNAALHAVADALEARTPEILEANARDMEAGRESGLSPALLDRLALDETRVAGIAAGVRSIAELPDTTRLLLLVAALSDDGRLDEILAASTAVAGTAVDLDAAAPAAEAGIVNADLQTIRFRHPLIRSAIAQSAGLAERRRVHEALADVLRDQPDRRAWHRAALLTGEHEDVALELEEQEHGRGGGARFAVAVTAMRRAAELGEPPAAAAVCSRPPGSPWSSAGGIRGRAAGRGRRAGSRRAGARAGHVGRGDRP